MELVTFPSAKWAEVSVALADQLTTGFKVLTSYKRDGTPAFYWKIEVQKGQLPAAQQIVKDILRGEYTWTTK